MLTRFVLNAIFVVRVNFSLAMLSFSVSTLLTEARALKNESLKISSVVCSLSSSSRMFHRCVQM